MRKVSTITISVIAPMICVGASFPASADAPGHGGRHRLVPNHAVGHARSPDLVVRRRAGGRVAVTRDFDPVPPDPLVVGFFRSLEGYGVYDPDLD